MGAMLTWKGNYAFNSFIRSPFLRNVTLVKEVFEGEPLLSAALGRSWRWFDWCGEVIYPRVTENLHYLFHCLVSLQTKHSWESTWTNNYIIF